MRSGTLAGAAAAAAIAGALAVLLAGRDDEAAAGGATPDFARDVAPIVRETCAGCHRPDGIAPFAFRTAGDLAARAAQVVRAVEAGRMPPWPPGPASPRYAGQARSTLDPAERDTLLRWARAQLVRPGAPRNRTPVGAPPATAAGPRPGERRLEVALPTPYRPRAAAGSTDDYRCFLLDPKLRRDAFVTSARIEPGAGRLVHHVILFRLSADRVGRARELDRRTPGPGWTCFGDTGVGGGGLDDAPWIAAWAPGGAATRLPAGLGIPLPRGSRIVLQVHYNLLNGGGSDRSRAVLTIRPGTAGLEPVQTMLLPAPVELPCAPGESGALCDRSRALRDLAQRYGGGAALAPSLLALLCGRGAEPAPGPVTTCDRRIDRPTTIHVVAGHMHLLGRSIRLELSPGTPRARVLLDIPAWDFHWQSTYRLAAPVRARRGDVVRVTCRHDARLRAGLRPAAARTPRYTVWGEGSTDEMCLGVLQVTRGP